MNPFETFSSWIKHRFSNSATNQPKLTPPEIKTNIDYVWPYSHFREYLINVGRDLNFIETIGNFPEFIDISSDWHSILNKMRAESTNREHYSLISINHINHSLLLQETSEVGDSGQIDSKTIRLARHKAISSQKIDRVIGDIHTHPRSSHDVLGGFSVTDFFYFIVNPSMEVMVVLDGDENLFAFKTKEAEKMNFNPGILNSEDFAKIFYSKNGYRYEGSSIYGERSVAIDPTTNIRQLNVDIAAEHHIAFYIGKANQPLKRIYPLKGVPIED